MPRYAPNKMPAAVKRRYFELIRAGMPGAEAARQVGVSTSCGSLWFIDAGSVRVFEPTPISRRFLSQDDRIEIADGRNLGEPVKSIAARIGKFYQTVYRELARNCKPDGSYQPYYAHNQAYQRRRRPKPRRLAAEPRLRELVVGKLRLRWSPEQIARWLRRRYFQRRSWHLCAETIYDSAYRGVLGRPDAARLRTGRVYRHRRGRGRTRDGALKQCTSMRSIHDRPAAVTDRRQIGHWEGDLIVGGGQRAAMATLVERKTRATVLVPLPYGYTARLLGDALIDMFTRLPAPLRRSLTWDQGNEMFHHPRIESSTGMQIYFADPHSPWQRGTNENMNGLLRQYFPKSADLAVYTAEHIHDVAAELNDRPRKCLDDLTPRQAMQRSGHRLDKLLVRNVR